MGLNLVTDYRLIDVNNINDLELPEYVYMSKSKFFNLCQTLKYNKEFSKDLSKIFIYLKKTNSPIFIIKDFLSAENEDSKENISLNILKRILISLSEPKMGLCELYVKKNKFTENIFIFKKRDVIIKSILFKKIDQIAKDRLRSKDINKLFLKKKEVIKYFKINEKDRKIIFNNIDCQNLLLDDISDAKEKLLSIKINPYIDDIVLTVGVATNIIEIFFLLTKDFLFSQEGKPFKNKVLRVTNKKLEFIETEIPMLFSYNPNNYNNDRLFSVIRILYQLLENFFSKKKRIKYQNIYIISKLLFFIFLNKKKEIKKELERVEVKNQAISIIEKYIMIDFYKKNKNLLISLHTLSKLTIKSNNIFILGEKYSNKEIINFLKKIDKVFFVNINDQTFVIHKYRLFLTTLYSIEIEKKRVTELLYSEWKAKKNQIIFKDQVKLEKLIESKTSLLFKKFIFELRKNIIITDKEKFYQFLISGMKKKIIDEKEIEYLEQINSKEKYNRFYKIFIKNNEINSISKILQIDFDYIYLNIIKKIKISPFIFFRIYLSSLVENLLSLFKLSKRKKEEEKKKIEKENKQEKLKSNLSILESSPFLIKNSKTLLEELEHLSQQWNNKNKTQKENIDFAINQMKGRVKVNDILEEGEENWDHIFTNFFSKKTDGIEDKDSLKKYIQYKLVNWYFFHYKKEKETMIDIK